MIGKNSKVFLINIENVESSNITPRLYIEHFGRTHVSDEVAVSFDESVGTRFLFLNLLSQKFTFSTSTLLLTVKRGTN